MAVLGRKLFNRGGQVSSRGVGITSGLVPVQKFENGGLAEKYKENLKMLKELNIFPETRPVSKLQAFSPALIKLGAGLMSGRSFQGGSGGGLDILGQSVQGAAPEIQQATQTIIEDKAKDPNAALRETALSLALKQDDKTEFSDPTEVTIRYDGTKENIPALRTFDKSNNAFVYQTTTGDPIDQEQTPFKVIRDKEKTNWNNPTDVKVLLNNGIETNAIRTFNPEDNVFSWTIPGSEVKLTPGNFKQVDDGSEDSKWTGATNVELIKKGDESGATVDAVRVLDGDGFKFINPANNTAYDMKNFDILKDDLTETKIKDTLDGTITYNGKEQKADFQETEAGIKIIDFRPDSPTFGQPININKIEGLTGFNITPRKEILSVSEQLELMAGEKSIQAQSDVAKNIADQITTSGNKANSVIQSTQNSLALLDKSGSGSLIEGRASFVSLLKLFNVDKSFPEEFKTMEDFVLQGGNLPATQVSIALAKQATIGRALEWDQQLNNTEVGLLIGSGPQVSLTKEGQRLLFETNLFNAEVNRDALNLYNDLVLNQKKTQIQAVKEVNDFKNQKYREYEEQTSDRIQEVLNYKSVRDISFFEQQKDIVVKGDDVDLSKAYDEGKLVFAGYADSDGIFRVTKKNGEVIEQRILRKDLPVYFYYHTDGTIHALEGGVNKAGQQ